MKDRPTVLVIDFNNIFYMSYYGPRLINSKGMNVGPIKTFFFKLRTFIESFEPRYIVFASDLSREKTFRRKMFPPYKSKRKPVDTTMVEMMRCTSQMIALLGYPMINNETYEADDIMGMISKLVVRNEMDCVITSSDRDLYQLVNDHVNIFNPRNAELITPEYIMMHYKLTPSQWVELKMLQGDKSDNIPGVNGIGGTIAQVLMEKYHCVNNIYEHLDELKPKMQESLTRDKDKLPLMRQLVTIVTDYSMLDLSMKSIERGEAFMPELYQLITELELFSLVKLMQYTFTPHPINIEQEVVKP